MKKLGSNQFLSDLYADLRDRRLLVPVIALIAAMIAVPVLLGGGSSETVPVVPASAVSDNDSQAVEPAVLAEQTGIRDYRKRLKALKQKNPFAQKFSLPTEKSVALEEETTTETATETATESAAGSATASASETITETANSISTSTDSSPAEPSTSADSDPEPQKPELRFYAGRVDVRFGQMGDTKVYEGLRRLDFLPDDKTPIVAFIGLSEGGDHAIFSISSDVSETSGDGACAPKKPAPCQFLNLKVGDERELVYGEEGTRYRLKLVETHFVRVADPRDK